MTPMTSVALVDAQVLVQRVAQAAGGVGRVGGVDDDQRAGA